MEEEPHSPLPSRVLDTFKIETITPDSEKGRNVGEQGKVTSPMGIRNLGVKLKWMLLGERMGRNIKKWKEITSNWRRPLWVKKTKSKGTQRFGS